MSDIVERLRLGPPYDAAGEGWALVEEAAAEIQRLRDERLSARAEAFERAAQIIDSNMLCEDAAGNEVMHPRTNPGNKVGLAYAAAIRAEATREGGEG